VYAADARDLLAIAKFLFNLGMDAIPAPSANELTAKNFDVVLILQRGKGYFACCNKVKVRLLTTQPRPTL